MPTKEVVEYKGKSHLQCNFKYVCTLKVAKDRHGLTLQPQDAGIIGLGFQRSQNSDESIKHRGRPGQRVEVEEDTNETWLMDEDESPTCILFF